MSYLPAGFVIAFIVAAALTRRRRRSSRFRYYDNGQYIGGSKTTSDADIVESQPPNFTPTEDVPIGGSPGFGRGAFGGHWDNLPNPDATRPRE